MNLLALCASSRRLSIGLLIKSRIRGGDDAIAPSSNIYTELRPFRSAIDEYKAMSYRECEAVRPVGSR
jgi:hypothetical protein